jgi:4-hydroxybenzoate polyprenyltransferase
MSTNVAKFLVSTSLLLSLDGALIVIFGSFLYAIQINPELAIASFLAVFSVYNLNKATDNVEDQVNRREIGSKSDKHYFLFSIIAMLVSLIIGALISFFSFLILITPIVIGFFYSIKISHKLPRLKEITGGKSLFVASCWSIIGAFLPLSLHPINFEKTGLVFTYIFVQVMVNTVLFDSLDAEGDLVSGIRTIPTALGPSRTKLVLVFTNSTLLLWLGFCYSAGLFVRFIPALLLGVIYCYLMIWQFLSKKSRKVVTDLIIDGEWLLIVPLMLLFIV